MAKKILISLAAVFIIVLVAVAVWLYPYYRMPPESKEELDAQLVRYQAVAEEMASRPKGARLALEALIKDWDMSFEPDSLFPFRKNACPAFDLNRVRSSESLLLGLRRYDERFEAMLQGGFVLQQDAGLKVVMPEFKTSRYMVYGQLGALALIKDKDPGADVSPRIENLYRYTDGFARTPNILYLMMSIAMEQRINQWIVLLLPRLSAEEILRLSSVLESLSDSNERFCDTLKVEVASLADLIDQSIRDQKTDGQVLKSMFPRHGQLIDRVGWLATATGYLTRERYTFLSMYKNDIDACTLWHEAGAQGLPDLPGAKIAKYSLLGTIARPKLSSLLSKTQENMAQRNALFKAMRMELKHREEGMTGSFELPYDKQHRIVIKPEYGCVVLNVTGVSKAQPPVD